MYFSIGRGLFNRNLCFLYLVFLPRIEYITIVFKDYSILKFDFNFDRLFLSTSNESTYLLNSFQSLPFNYEKARHDNGKGDQRFESCEKICLQIFLINNSATTKRRNFDGLCTRAPSSSLNL